MGDHPLHFLRPAPAGRARSIAGSLAKGALLLAMLLTGIGCDRRRAGEFRLLQLNIWYDATEVAGAFEALVDRIAEIDAEVVSLCEVTDRNGPTLDRLLRALEERGQRWYGASGHYDGVQGTDVCVLSKYPIREAMNDLATVSGGVDMKVRIDVDGYDVLLYTTHLDYTHYACYLPRGYDGVTWQRLPAAETSPEAILRMNRASTRDEAMRAFLADAATERADLILLAGDFNEPSHLDWCEATSQLWDHRGCVIPWDCSVLLYEGGFRDAYRTLHPDPATHPGFTYPSDNALKEPRELTWAPEADERDRIDFVYYLPGGYEPVAAAVVGPASSIVRCERVRETGADPFVEPAGAWPTDHKGLLVAFRPVR